ncbi:hypothetical protein EV681_2895 [Advenella incenata]|uniref:Uncharacterized protein n=2 Tax=Advenella incenata TaxID=267800 RepID=A0A4Q7VCM3_9BURK|nr:hypothetical protein EV681_2895 [Advenella incenata]
MGMDKSSKKSAIKRFLIWQVVVALVLLVGFWYLRSDYSFVVVFFIELYAVSKLEDGLITLPASVIRYQNIYENGTDAIASVIKVEGTGRVTESGAYYIFTVVLEAPPVELVIEEEILDSQVCISNLSTIPVRYLPDTMEAIILTNKL